MKLGRCPSWNPSPKDSNNTNDTPELPKVKRQWNAPLLLIHLIVEHGFILSAFDNNGRCQNE